MLELKTAVIKQILDIELKGALDSQSASDFKAWMLEKNVAGYSVFALNCRSLEFISSRGISSLIEVHRVLQSRHGAVVLYYVRNEVLNLLEFLKISGEIPVLSDFDEIVASYGPKAKAPAADSVKAGASEGAEEDLPADSPELPYSPSLRRPESAPDKEEIVNLKVEDDGFSPSSSSSGAPGVQREAATRTKQADLKSNSSPTELLEQARMSSTGVPAGVADQDERYIDLSADSELMANETSAKSVIVFCPNCGESLKVRVAGQYLCPECRSKFHYPFE